MEFDLSSYLQQKPKRSDHDVSGDTLSSQADCSVLTDKKVNRIDSLVHRAERGRNAPGRRLGVYAFSIDKAPGLAHTLAIQNIISASAFITGSVRHH